MGLEERLLEIERRLWTNDAAFYEAHLVEEALLVFPETGVVTRGFAVAAIRTENAEGRRWAEVRLDDVRTVRLAGGPALLTYRVAARWAHEATELAALASSVYVERDGAWKVAFHQQTPVPAACELRPVGFVRSALKRPEDAPRQGDEGAPDAWIEVAAGLAKALRGIEVGQELVVLTWLHEARRDVLEVHPRGDESRPLTGVFATRSPARPNPVGLHRVRVLEIAGTRLRVAPLEAIDGTPVVDVKPVLPGVGER